ncbi:MAG: hypothetical protein IT355_15685 [Gemmatimonadaceae bacterium]|nr:hypothetical protein [Gemmatimonadaceae bacterium]
MTAGTTTWQRIAAVLRLEWRVQRREPLTVLYALVLGLLAAAFAAAGPVELVRGRGSVPRDAAWSMMLASSALTAFGQVITTMVAATVVLRDRHDRVAELLAVTPLSRREYLTGKLLAALGVLGLVYSAIPVGLVAGAVGGGGTLSQAMTASLPPFVMVVLPTMLAVGLLQFGVGVLSGRLWVLVGLGLVLIWFWSGAVDVVTAGRSGLLPVLLDPFGSAPLLQATLGWSDAERVARGMPVTLGLVLSRGLWVTLGGLVALRALLAGDELPRPRLVPDGAPQPPIGDAPPLVQPMRAMAPLPAWRAALGTARHGAAWMLRDAGWRVLSLLGAVNVGVHAWLDGRQVSAPSAADVTLLAYSAVTLHARLFLILLATIYAGELVWREREDRSAAFFDVLPVADGALIAGRVAGVVAAQGVVVGLLAVAAAVGAGLGAGVVPDVAWLSARVVAGVLAPFVGWMIASLAVHVLVQQKVVAHLLCIAGWVLAVMLLGAARAEGAAVGPWMVTGVMLLAATAIRVGWVRGTGRVV